MSVPSEVDRRVAVVTAIDQAAVWVATHPAAPPPNYVHLQVHVDDIGALKEFADAFDVEIHEGETTAWCQVTVSNPPTPDAAARVHVAYQVFTEKPRPTVAAMLAERFPEGAK